jgi:hypothetical protein
MHLDLYHKTGTELLMGSARFVGPNTIEAAVAEGGTRTLHGKTPPLFISASDVHIRMKL